MNTMDTSELNEFWSRFSNGLDTRAVLWLAALGLALAGLILSRLYRARIQRRLQAAAAAYANRELARDGEIRPSAYAA